MRIRQICLFSRGESRQLGSVQLNHHVSSDLDRLLWPCQKLGADAADLKWRITATRGRGMGQEKMRREL